MKKVKFILIFLSLHLILNAQENTDKLKAELLKNDSGLRKILRYPVEIIKSQSKNYYFVYIPGDEKRQYGNSIPISQNITVCDVVFIKGEINWFFVYDGNSKKIIAKDSNIMETGAFNGAGEIDCNNDFLIFDLGTSPFRSLFFYNLKKPLSKPVKMDAFAGRINGKRGDYLISPDSRYIAYVFPLIKPEDEGNGPPEASLKIRDVLSGRDYEILPVIKFNIYEIVKWESNNVLIYDEYKDYMFIDEQIVNKRFRFEIK